MPKAYAPIRLVILTSKTFQLIFRGLAYWSGVIFLQSASVNRFARLLHDCVLPLGTFISSAASNGCSATRRTEPKNQTRRTATMAMTTGEPRGSSAEINVTPLIDVLLVLLIVFLVIQ